MADSKRSQKSWAHEGAIPLSEVDADAFYSGTVTNVGQYGVFVNFGAVKDALLKVPSKVGRRMKRGMELEGLAVLSIDADAGKVIMEVDEDKLPELPPRPKKRSQSAGARLQAQKSGGGGNASQRKRSKPRKAWDHEGATAMEDLQVGDVLQGTVTNVSVYGVFVDVGAVRDARLNVNSTIGRRFRIGDVVEDCTLSTIDLETQRMSASLPDPEAAVRDLPPKEPKPKAQPRPESAKPKGKAKAKAKARASSAAPRPAQEGDREGGIPIEKLKVGAVVDGIVTNRNQYGVFVNIGCRKDAKLDVPKRMTKEFQRGDEVYGMTIESVDLDRAQITCILEDPELSVEEEVVPKPKARASSRGPPAAKAPASKPKAKAKSKTEAGARGRSNSAPSRRYRVGGIADGVVTNITPQGVFVDIGAANDAVLKLPRAIAQQFEAGDEVHGMVVEAVRSTAGVERITLSLEDPELDEPPPSKPQPKKAAAKPKAKATAEDASGKGAGKAAGSVAKAKAKAKAGAKDWAHEDGLHFADLEVGAGVEGTVTNVNNYGVFVDFGAVKDGKLLIAREEWKKFRKGDRIEGMVIAHVDEDAKQIGLGLTFELGEEPEQDAPPPRQARPRSRPPASGAGAKVRSAPAATSPAGRPARPSSARPGASGGGKPKEARRDNERVPMGQKR